MSEMLRGELGELITEANASGWSISLRQHPDLRGPWECAVSRRAEPSTPNGIARDYAYAQGYGPYTALAAALALVEAKQTCRCEPAGITGQAPQAPAVNLLDLLGLSKPTVPIITRRI